MLKLRIIKGLNRYFRNVQQKCWNLIDKKCPEIEDRHQQGSNLLRKSLDNLSRAKPIVLDAGCGHTSKIYVNSSNVTYIGTDYVIDDLKRNKNISSGFKSNLSSIPLKTNSIDVIVSNMVLEHLVEPESVFREFNRILRSDGYLIFTTPSIFGLVTILKYVVPEFIVMKLANYLTGINETDVFPAVYKVNSIKKIRRIAEVNNLIEKDLILYQPPPYAFVFSRYICQIAIYYYWIISRYNFLKSLRGVIIARYQKSENTKSNVISE